ncbi:uncharacterized protein UV8b_06426 [Ustilaginoidea virens]|uniref:Vacuolar ATPase assembly protein VMA22 n=1 Tax=Ustilaginoidea virens TaxID=1159556 RepID=A0A1B5L9X6_USTVR|nr:uncharacterized protein UV8b_06426 [Ustilaginoidea virens]QUC22185.1 hypothetical protein UV8b_06426 [Ustilaginoidea virens]GAO19668.1 hypothetical protein UVI_02047670 [Ustilaginoidea virens]
MNPDQQDIDHLLQRYLCLLEEYTRLRQELSRLQALVYRDIARANFLAERGLRFGQDQYDDRMRASRRLTILQSEHQAPEFRTKAHPFEAQDGQETGEEGVVSDDEHGKGTRKDARRGLPHDPLRWFGILTPMPLRTARSHSARAVEDVIPRLASVDAEMRRVEIEVRRARKRQSKAGGAVSKGSFAVCKSAEGIQRQG